MFANCILFATFCSMGTLVSRKKKWCYSARKVMEFGQLMIDILVNVSCKFEMYILKIAQVINENVRIAFLYVLSILTLLAGTSNVMTMSVTVMYFSLEKILTLKAIKSHFEKSYDKQNITRYYMVISYEMTTRVISSI